jgi:hypothetical protein
LIFFEEVLNDAVFSVSSDSGIAVREMRAVRRLKRKINKTTATSAAPSIKEWVTLLMAWSMKLAWRKSAG